jgi:hypothetical protein
MIGLSEVCPHSPRGVRASSCPEVGCVTLFLFTGAPTFASGSIVINLDPNAFSRPILDALATNQGATMSRFDDLATAVTTLTDTVTRVAADLVALKAAGTLSPADAAAVDKAIADLTGDETTLETADPAPVA